ncbi:metal ABC transporter solute-binding protein, Zn/Mn family [Staphylococcus caprae]|uniref:metal ABC transporter solute-binding protein, Zn/Mn family n=1 Tax=Staphylococcus caprae TaxID=29380 RepID=UPI000CD1A333|nr:zinc ABC transporter solute-binding protein [Staphylococcus caprae]POA03471.1 ABC transporter substrate-binding protein [Staphylococcus caprae]SUL94682.1 adhesion lipoprotein [Staphylococcus caprae]HCG74700.1 ABC transporter substrate-binding protein [Staphylococcus sp.]
MKRKAIIWITLSIILILSGCSKSMNHKKDNISSQNKMKIYTTVFAFQSFTQQIGGKYVDVESIYPPGADLHSYEPTQKDMINIAKSDLFIYSNDDLDPVSAKITQSMENKNMKLALANGLKQKDLIHSDDHDEDWGHQHHHESSNDPHIWLDPVLDRVFAKEIKDKLIQKDPKHKSYYEENYKKLDKEIKDIDNKMKRITKNPKRDKVIISHDSLGYLAHRYHFKQEGVNGMNDEEPSQKKILSIVKEIKKSKSPYVLYEQNITSKITDVIKKETDTQPLSFHNLAVLTKKEQNDDAITYQSLMKKDIQSLEKALNH